MSHEKTISFEMNGRHFVIPTVIGDHKVDPEEAIRLFRTGAIRPFGQFSTQIEADSYARERSRKSGSH